MYKFHYSSSSNDHFYMKSTIMKVYFILIFSALSFNLFGQAAERQSTIYPPFVNQLGYNLGESKRFVCYGAQDNTCLLYTSPSPRDRG